MARVTIVDDGFRHNSYTTVTKSNQKDLEKILKCPLRIGTLLPIKDRFKRVVQDVVEMAIVFEGAHLERAIVRARRWMRSGKFGTESPRHITYMLMAYKNHDPESFGAYLNETAKG